MDIAVWWTDIHMERGLWSKEEALGPQGGMLRKEKERETPGFLRDAGLPSRTSRWFCSKCKPGGLSGKTKLTTALKG